jgi:hypothetical protein
MGVFCGGTYLANSAPFTRFINRKVRSVAAPMLLLVIAVLTIDLPEAWRVSKNSYEDHPDHKGAARFVESVQVNAADVVVAEDSIVQSYYLDRVDYRLQSLRSASRHGRLVDGVLYDQYSGTPVLGSGEALIRIVERSRPGRTFVIGSAQVSPSLKTRNRADGIGTALESPAFSVVYVGRDRETLVWRAR